MFAEARMAGGITVAHGVKLWVYVPDLNELAKRAT
jgi:hypothetical protein